MMRTLLLVFAICCFTPTLTQAAESKFQQPCASNLQKRSKALPLFASLFVAGSLLSVVPHFLTSNDPHPETNSATSGACAKGASVNIDVYSKADPTQKLGRFTANAADPKSDKPPCLDTRSNYNFAITFDPPAPVQEPVDEAGPEDPEGFAARKLETVYRYYGPAGHFFALSKSGAGVPSDFHYEGPVFAIYVLHYPETTGLYRCNLGTQQYLSTNKGCESQPPRPGKLLGYITAPSTQGLAPLYRLRNESGDYIEDTEYKALLDAGFTVEGVLGQVPGLPPEPE